MADITLIVPVYNGEKFLTELLESVIHQSYSNWNCICVNDGSTDTSLSILRAYAEQDNRITIIDQPNQSCGVARNNAIKQVTSEYVMFADQDDLLHPQAFEIALNAIQQSQTDVVRFEMRRFTDSPRFEQLKSNPIPSPSKRTSIFVWRHIFKTAAVKEIAFPPISGGEDIAWMHELEWQKLSFAKIDAGLYYNRQLPTSRSRGISQNYVNNVRFAYKWMRTRAKALNVMSPFLQLDILRQQFMFELSVIYRKYFR